MPTPTHVTVTEPLARLTVRTRTESQPQCASVWPSNSRFRPRGRGGMHIRASSPPLARRRSAPPPSSARPRRPLGALVHARYEQLSEQLPRRRAKAALAAATTAAPAGPRVRSHGQLCRLGGELLWQRQWAPVVNQRGAHDRVHPVLACQYQSPGPRTICRPGLPSLPQREGFWRQRCGPRNWRKLLKLTFHQATV